MRRSKAPPPGVTTTRVSAGDIVAAMRQSTSARTRTKAIGLFGKALRRVDRFQATWDAVGGAVGLVELMAEFSVRDVRFMCRWLGRTGSAVKARPDRRQALEEVVMLLRNQPADKRPLREAYQDIIPGCTPEMVQKCENDNDVEWSSWQQKRLFFGHRELNQKTFLENIFKPDETVVFQEEKRLYCDNFSFCEEILQVLLSKEQEDKLRIPHDFMVAFAMPALKRLLKKRSNTEPRDRFLGLVLQCVSKYPVVLADQLHLGQDGLIQYVIARWLEAPVDRKEAIKTQLIQLIQLMPTIEHPPQLNVIHFAVNCVRKHTRETKYGLLKLILQNMKGYRLDIEDDSEAGLELLNDRLVKGDAWPAKMFFCLQREKGLQLFERLVKSCPSGLFLFADTAGDTILKQARSLDDARHGDVEIVGSLLIRNLNNDAKYPGWLQRVRDLVHERRKKAQQSREPPERTFWASGALNLCVAAGDLETFRDTVVWARRFNKDPLTVQQLYGGQVFNTREIKALLGVLPQAETPAAAVATLESAKAGLELADKILINLVETAVMAIQEPTFQHYHWNTVLQLPKAVTNWRVKHVKTLQDIIKSSSPNDTDLVIQEAIWKPTLDTAIEVETLLCKPTLELLRNLSPQVEALSFHVLRELKEAPPAMISELASFLFDQMKTRLGPELYKARLRHVVEVIVRIASSDQPSLACPFIRDMIMDDEDNSAWYRRFLHVGFLSSLPAGSTKEFLFGLATAMKDKMHAQHTRPKGNTNVQQVPAIKVTTIKLMAQLLQNNKFLDPPSSCEILVGLLSETRHVDAQIAIVSSLLSTMQEPGCREEIRTGILDAFEKYAVPVAAQLSEHRRLSKSDWDAAEQDGGKIPEIGEGTPFLLTLANQAERVNLDLRDKFRLAQLFMKAVEMSATAHDRWMKLFLAKNGFTLDADEKLPASPARLEVLTTLFADWKEYMPASVFQILRNMVLTNLSPTPGIARITKAIRANGDLLNSNSGRHWIDQFDNDHMGFSRIQLDRAATALQRPSEEAESKLDDEMGIRIRMLQDFLLDATELLLPKGSPEIVDGLVYDLCARRFDTRENWDSWQSNCIPVLYDMVTRIEKFRSRQADPPVLLSNPFRLLIKALPIPYSSFEQAAVPEEKNIFISHLSGLVSQLSQRRTPYHEDFLYLKERVIEAPRRSDFPWFALELVAKVSQQELSLADYLKLELAAELLAEAENPADKEIVEKTREVVNGWKNSTIDELRKMGFLVVERLTMMQGEKSWFFYDGADIEMGWSNPPALGSWD